MDDVRDTLARWAAQTIAIVGLNVCGWGFLFHMHLAESEGEGSVELWVLLLPLVAVPFWRLLSLRRWSAWAACALLAWRCVGAHALLEQKGGRSWSSFLTQFWPTFAGALGCALAGMALLYLLLARPQVWSDEF